jgi:hypothetical protein
VKRRPSTFIRRARDECSSARDEASLGGGLRVRAIRSGGSMLR